MPLCTVFTETAADAIFFMRNKASVISRQKRPKKEYFIKDKVRLCCEWHYVIDDPLN